MTAQILDGNEIARRVRTDVQVRSEELRQRGVVPSLAFVRIGESAPAEVYVRRLERLAKHAGIEMMTLVLPEEIAAEEFGPELAALDSDPRIDGIIVQMPLPVRLRGVPIGELIDVRKDVDGATIHNAGRLYLGLPGQRPSTALAIVEVLDASGTEISGSDAVIVGRSPVAGHPAAELLLARNATITVTHRSTQALAGHIRRADIVIAAAGAPRLIRGDMIKPGATVVDAGINVTPDGIVGDVDFDSAVQTAGAITPVPGGVGPVTNAVLLRNVVESAERRSA
ncbi:MAG TPA: bifunctional 5,10-methylenetetrahydrofolate dehydrogenase/5,10-methenyltetrahydrofolate cyclohydrolase [Chloroflexota bacterium]|nr:bifunctional 5,10-methylenetetrahydrofolate dehydrogenase/5,10-methenyltetrahydrofolate cyclohydrolase [Chloroflexota bacterium]